MAYTTINSVFAIITYTCQTVNYSVVPTFVTLSIICYERHAKDKISGAGLTLEERKNYGTQRTLCDERTRAAFSLACSQCG